MPYEFYLGLDAQRTGDNATYTAALIEKSGGEGAANSAHHRAHLLKRYEDADPSAVADDVLREIAAEPFAGRTILVMNVSEKEGRELHSMLHARGASPITISVTPGNASSEQGWPLSFSSTGEEVAHVSEREIVSSVGNAYRSGRLELDIIKDDITSALVRGVEAYQEESDMQDAADDVDLEDGDDAELSVKIDLRQSTRDADLVLAAGAACWLAEQRRFDPTEHLSGPPPPVREPKRSMRPDSGKTRTPAP